METSTAPLALQVASPLLGAGFVAFLIQRGFRRQDEALEGIRKRMDCFERSQHACQLGNTKEFATKDEVREDSRTQWERLDDHEQRISRLEGREGL